MNDTKHPGPSRGGRPLDGGEVSTFSAKQLLANGLEELRAGAGLLNVHAASETDVRRALREVASGIELVFKSFLAAEHWALVFENPAAASADAFARGEFKSVGFAACIDRLQSITKLRLTDAHRRELYRMRTRRNQLEHLGLLDNALAVRAAIGGALHSVASLVKQAAETGLLEGADNQLHSTLAIELSEVDDFVKARWNDIKGKVTEGAVTCPACIQRACDLIEYKWVCLFCDTQTEPHQVAESFLENDLGLSSYSVIKGGGEWPLYQCPECDDETLVGLDDGNFRCFGCGETFEHSTITWCRDCNRPLAGDGESFVCTVCFRNRFNADD
jgi:hypothetical protein